MLVFKFGFNKNYFLIFIFLLANIVFAQKNLVDSLKLALKIAKHDTTRCNILFQLAEVAPDGETEKFNEQLKNLAEINLKNLANLQNESIEFKNTKSTPLNKLFKKHYASSLNNLGLISSNKGDIIQALYYYDKSLKIQKEIGDKKGMATSLNDLGAIYSDQGDIQKALNYYGKSLKIQEEIADKQGIAATINNLGLIYEDQGEVAKALNYFEKSLKMQEEIGSKRGIASSLINIGYIYSNQGDILKALGYYSKSLKIFEEIGDKRGITQSLNNIGYIYKSQGDLTKALNYFSKSLKIRKEIDDKVGIANSLNNIGSVYLKQKNYKEAFTYCTKSMLLSKELGYPENIKYAASQLSKIYKAKNDYKNAFENYELYIQMRDSISNIETKKASIKNQLKYEYDKQALADSIQLADTKKLNKAKVAEGVAKLKQQKTQRLALISCLILLLGFSAFIFNRFKKSQKQKLLIEKQKKVVDESQKKIIDSINYAQKIQNSMLPNGLILLNYFSDMFLLFKPKDIVSGDFYWLHETPVEILFALGDSTGHGVPGALTSILCQNSLDAACRELTELDPNKILRIADTYLKQKTSKQTNVNVDGMAVSLINYNKSSKILKFSAVNQSIYILRNNEVIEFKSTSFSVGSLPLIELKEESMQLQSNDMIYLLSDGFPDQKGGTLKRRLTTAKVKQLLINNAQKPCLEQKNNLDTEFETWKLCLEQIDDVLVVGLKV